MAVNEYDAVTVTLAAVISLDGKLTRGSDPHIRAWASAEDIAHYESLVGLADVVVVGRKTWQSMRIGKKDSALYIIMTRQPETYRHRYRAGRREFTAAAPKRLVADVSARGYRHILVIGGSEIYSLYLQARLINKLYITIEPNIFGRGTSFISTAATVDLMLEDCRRLNGAGTVLLTYRADASGKRKT